MRTVLLVPLGATPVLADGTAPDRARLGTLALPISGAPAAQADFVAGVLHMHSCECDDAAGIRAAQAKDPGFAMAYRDEPMTRTHPMWNEQDLESARAERRLRDVAIAPTALPLAFGPPDFVRPPYDSLGESLLADARPAEPRRAVEAALALMPGRWLSLRGLPQATEAPAVAAM